MLKLHMKPKRVLAGIAEGDVETAKRRLKAGEVFYYYANKLHYSDGFIADGFSPYRFESVSIVSSWWYVHKWRVEE